MTQLPNTKALYEANRLKKLLQRYFENSAVLSPTEREEAQHILDNIRLNLIRICKYVGMANSLLNQAAHLSKNLEGDLGNMYSMED